MITFDVIEHFTREELIPLVDEVYRVLKPGGCWIIHTPNGESPFSGRMRYWDLTNELALTRISIAQLLFSSGFSQVQSFEDEPIPHSFISAGRWMLWKMIRSILRLYLAVEMGDRGKEAIFTQNFLTAAVK
jgi:SAM-dependent methyltransferase